MTPFLWVALVALLVFTHGTAYCAGRYDRQINREMNDD